jgi:hypothetical protein
MGIKYIFNPTTGSLDAVSVETPAGADTEIQFNNAGVFGADSDLTWDDTSNPKVLGIGGDINLDDGGTYTTTLQTVTPTQNNTISFPDATGTVGLVAGSSGNLVVNQSGAYAGVANSSVDDATGNITLGSRFISSLNGAASAPPGAFTGTWFTGGTATTTKPQVVIEPAGTTSTSWSTSGTGLGVNAASGFAGNLLDLQVNGTAILNATAVGGISAPRSALDGGTLAGYFFRSGTNTIGFRCDTNNNIGVFTRATQTFSSYMFGSTARPIFKLGSSFSIAWGSNDVAVQANEDLIILRDAADTLAQRRTTNAQTFRVYNTFTSATNFERAKLQWDTNVLKVGTEKGADGGTARDMELQTDGVTRLKADTIGSLEVATALTVATLPSSPVVGMLARVTDADAPTLGATVVGGESDNALVWYNGTNWTVIGV